MQYSIPYLINNTRFTLHRSCHHLNTREKNFKLWDELVQTTSEKQHCNGKEPLASKCIPLSRHMGDHWLKTCLFQPFYHGRLSAGQSGSKLEVICVAWYDHNRSMGKGCHPFWDKPAAGVDLQAGHERAWRQFVPQQKGNSKQLRKGSISSLFRKPKLPAKAARQQPLGLGDRRRVTGN